MAESSHPEGLNRLPNIPPIHNHTIDLASLTPTEEQILKAVLAKDVQALRPVDEKVEILRQEMDKIRQNMLPKPGEKNPERMIRKCRRCRRPFGIWRVMVPFVDKGRHCVRCSLKVCKRCRIKQENGLFLCSICIRLKEEAWLTGEWTGKGCFGLAGSDLLRASLRDREYHFKRQLVKAITTPHTSKQKKPHKPHAKHGGKAKEKGKKGKKDKAAKGGKAAKGKSKGGGKGKGGKAKGGKGKKGAKKKGGKKNKSKNARKKEADLNVSFGVVRHLSDEDVESEEYKNQSEEDEDSEFDYTDKEEGKSAEEDEEYYEEDEEEEEEEDDKDDDGCRPGRKWTSEDAEAMVHDFSVAELEESIGASAASEERARRDKRKRLGSLMSSPNFLSHIIRSVMRDKNIRPNSLDEEELMKIIERHASQLGLLQMEGRGPAQDSDNIPADLGQQFRASTGRQESYRKYQCAESLTRTAFSREEDVEDSVTKLPHGAAVDDSGFIQNFQLLSQEKTCKLHARKTKCLHSCCPSTTREETDAHQPVKAPIFTRVQHTTEEDAGSVVSSHLSKQHTVNQTNDQLEHSDVPGSVNSRSFTMVTCYSDPCHKPSKSDKTKANLQTQVRLHGRTKTEARTSGDLPECALPGNLQGKSEFEKITNVRNNLSERDHFQGQRPNQTETSSKHCKSDLSRSLSSIVERRRNSADRKSKENTHQLRETGLFPSKTKCDIGIKLKEAIAADAAIVETKKQGYGLSENDAFSRSRRCHQKPNKHKDLGDVGDDQVDEVQRQKGKFLKQITDARDGGETVTHGCVSKTDMHEFGRPTDRQTKRSLRNHHSNKQRDLETDIALHGISAKAREEDILASRKYLELSRKLTNNENHTRSQITTVSNVKKPTEEGLEINTGNRKVHSPSKQRRARESKQHGSVKLERRSNRHLEKEMGDVSDRHVGENKRPKDLPQLQVEKITGKTTGVKTRPPRVRLIELEGQMVETNIDEDQILEKRAPESRGLGYGNSLMQGGDTHRNVHAKVSKLGERKKPFETLRRSRVLRRVKCIFDNLVDVNSSSANRPRQPRGRGDDDVNVNFQVVRGQLDSNILVGRQQPQPPPGPGDPQALEQNRRGDPVRAGRHKRRKSEYYGSKERKDRDRDRDRGDKEGDRENRREKEKDKEKERGDRDRPASAKAGLDIAAVLSQLKAKQEEAALTMQTKREDEERVERMPVQTESKGSQTEKKRRGKISGFFCPFCKFTCEYGREF